MKHFRRNVNAQNVKMHKTKTAAVKDCRFVIEKPITFVRDSPSAADDLALENTYYASGRAVSLIC